jgi:hypothetical protein
MENVAPASRRHQREGVGNRIVNEGVSVAETGNPPTGTIGDEAFCIERPEDHPNGRKSGVRIDSEDEERLVA